MVILLRKLLKGHNFINILMKFDSDYISDQNEIKLTDFEHIFVQDSEQ